MFKSIRFFLPVFASVLLAASAASAQQVGIADADWQGNDFVIRFDDSLSSGIDYAASDSTKIVVNLSRPIASDTRQFAGPDGIVAALTRSGNDSVSVLTVHGKSRIGYSLLWRPYSHRLIIHTFNWDSLGYAPEQYHKGLLAMEQPEGLSEAKEYLSGANVFGDRRAASVLGVLYEREGEDSLAALYLTAPLDADDYMARANMSRRAGDTEAAKRNQEHFERKLGDQTGLSVQPQQDPERSTEQTPQETTGKTSLSELFDDWRGIALVILAALFIVVLAVWFSRRPSELSEKPLDEPLPPPSHGVEAPVPSPAATAVEEEEKEAETEAPAVKAEREAPSPLTSSVQTPEITLAPDQVEKESDTSSAETDDTQLPRPDALPAEPEIIRDIEKTAKAAETTPHRQSSSQAEQLRQRMANAQSDAPQSSVAKSRESSPAADDESTLNEARRLHVSRDFVELRNRISELKK